MNASKLRDAKRLFDRAAKHSGDAAHAINVVADGLSKLTEALIELSADIDALKAAADRKRPDVP